MEESEAEAILASAEISQLSWEGHLGRRTEKGPMSATYRPDLDFLPSKGRRECVSYNAALWTSRDAGTDLNCSGQCLSRLHLCQSSFFFSRSDC